jgi:hypothetical protein
MSQNGSFFCTEEYAFNYLVFTEMSDKSGKCGVKGDRKGKERGSRNHF